MLYCIEHKPGMAQITELHGNYVTGNVKIAPEILFATKLSFRLEHPPLERLVRAGSRIGSSAAETVSTACTKEQSSCRVAYN